MRTVPAVSSSTPESPGLNRARTVHPWYGDKDVRLCCRTLGVDFWNSSVAAHALLEGEQQARLLEERQVRVPEQQRLVTDDASSERLQSSD
jgi:hypothetical protein